MTPVLSNQSSPARCALVTIDAPMLAWLLRIPEGHKLDSITHDGEVAQLFVSGPDMPMTEPGYPIPRMQLSVTVDPNGAIVASRLAPVSEDLGAPAQLAPDAALTELRHQQGVQVDGLETWVSYEYTKHRMRALALLEHAGRDHDPALLVDIYEIKKPATIEPMADPFEEAVSLAERITWSKAFVTEYEARMQGFVQQGLDLCVELFGQADPVEPPPHEIPAAIMARFTLGGRIPIEQNYLDATYPANWPIIYTDRQIDFYIEKLRRGEWFIYGQTDFWMWDAIAAHPIAGLDVVNMGSLTPWYEATCLHFGAKPTTIDYNPILNKSARLTTMTTRQWDELGPDAPRFDVGWSISSFEHDGLGMYGDPLDPDGDLKAMKKMRRVIKPGGLLFLSIPVGKDKILFNNARIYGRIRLPMLMSGWQKVGAYGMLNEHYDGPGHVQPVFILRNVG